LPASPRRSTPVVKPISQGPLPRNKGSLSSTKRMPATLSATSLSDGGSKGMASRDLSAVEHQKRHWLA
jgi:hypothetical protein